MLKKFLEGLFFGTGFGLAFLALSFVATVWIFPLLLKSNLDGAGLGSSDEAVVGGVPPITDSKNFLGSQGVYSGDFRDNRSGVLAAGEGTIRGKALVDEAPLEGLKLRLALNGSVMSQWARTGEDGNYRVSVPYGKYRVDGYEIDYSTANDVLPGKIDHPRNHHSTGTFQVGPDQEGQGLTLRFVDPVIKRMDQQQFSSSDPVVLKWEPYPEAAEYTVQIHEKSDADSWRSKSLFHWPERPRTTDTALDLTKYDVELKPGHFYSFEIHAEDEEGHFLSTTHRTASDYDFEVVNQ